jgi:ATP-dependent DNA helicase RecG
MNLNKIPLTSLSNIGDKQQAAFAELGLTTVWDLLTYFPFRYEDLHLTNLAQAEDDSKVTVQVELLGEPSVRWLGKKKSRMSVRATVDGLVIQIVWFNQHFLKKQLRPGRTIAVTGRFDRPRLQITASKTICSEEEQKKQLGRLEPVYSLHQQMRMNTLRKAVYEAYRQYGAQIEEILPEAIWKHYRFLPRNQAMYRLHFPRTHEELHEAQRRMIYEELFLYECQIFWLKQRTQQQSHGIAHAFSNSAVEEFLEQLPFPLTGAQQRVIGEIFSDLRAAQPMNRLLQGDVGSGKTVIAAIALYANYLSGYQGALLVPTEILAEQHAATLTELLAPFGLEVVLLLGGMRAKARRELLAKIEAGTAHVVVGTHALLTEAVTFHKLGLAITDEQHRFGVKQRALLRQKGHDPDVLCMTATPIPRTLAITIFGEMDVSIIDELPAGRQPIETYWVKKDLWSRVVSFMQKGVKKGRQAYVICPLIEESEKIDLQNAQELYEQLITQLAPIRVGLLHGRMPREEKEEIMSSFQRNEVQVLVSTTVVEVGVNVPNATVMVIYDADRFGLSQLHQLRGRVGRGQYASTCILVADPKTETGIERMRVMSETTDGFVIAEKDLALRGPGDFLGVKQSGLPEFKVADLTTDQTILHYARADAAETVASLRKGSEGAEALHHWLENRNLSQMVLD